MAYMRFERLLLLVKMIAIGSISACAAPTELDDNATARAPDWLYPDVVVTPSDWPVPSSPPLDPLIEARIDEILPRLTLEQKVGQVVQGDSEFVTPDDVRTYRLGAVLSGGNSAPGEEPFADAEAWLALADAYFEASLDAQGVEIPIPVIWGIDAVHGHTNLVGATVFPHNIGLGAARDPDLIGEIARVTAAELVVSGHDWTFAPTLAVPRDDRWGRSYEGFSEDPEIARSYSAAIVEGLQGRPGESDWLRDRRVLSSAKHFLADGGTENGRDQGNAIISETDLRDIHGAGYVPAIEAGVQTIMASFSSWQGIKIHGSHALLTGILKNRMGFSGFIVGDWNAHGQIPGCTNTDCPQALLAGLDMYMAPDSWRGVYDSTLKHVSDGTIPMERLDDAVRRILRVKLAYGLFDKPKPSLRAGAGETSLLSSPEHRAIARRAVRQSMVLLKNDGGVLPLKSNQTVLVVGDGADSISKASGGWTLSWQGGGYENAQFPKGETILSGIRRAVESSGGKVIFDPEGTSGASADVVIAVYGEDPYAEFQGDLDDLDFQPAGFDTKKLSRYREDGMKVVSVFLSGRPLWVNPEINASDAFVAAWLPGSEGGGIADLLFRTDPNFDFSGKLSFSWPANAVQTTLNRGDSDYAPLLAYGFGRSYSDPGADLGILPENSGLPEGQGGARGDVFVRGQTAREWVVSHRGAEGSLSRIDHLAQEDAYRLSALSAPADLAFVTSGDGVDWSRESNGAIELRFQVRSIGTEATGLRVAIGCDEEGNCPAEVIVRPSATWQEHRISLGCFATSGVDMTNLRNAATFRLAKGEVAIADIALSEDKDGKPNCGS